MSSAELKKVLINSRGLLRPSVQVSQQRAKTEKPATMERLDGLGARVDAPAALLLEPTPTIHYHCDRITEWSPIITKISPRDSAFTTQTFPSRGPVLPPSTHIQRLIPSALWAIGLLVMMATAGQSVQAAGDDETRFKQIRPQFIAALGDPGANSGSGAQQWGLWRLDPGPRGVWLKHYERLQAAGGVAPARWKFDEADWWVEENGLIMEKPQFPLPPGQYVVTGGREVTTVLTVHPMDQDGDQRWELRGNATIHDVTHLRCRSARYTPAAPDSPCSPAKAQMTEFPVAPGGLMPPVEGCNKQDYSVLFIIGVAVEG